MPCCAFLVAALLLPLDARAETPALVAQVLSPPHADDLDGLVKRRQVRAAVAWSRTDYFVERGQPYGMAYESAREFEAWLNRRHGRVLRRIHVVLVPATRAELVTMLEDGRADIAIAGLTITPERAARIDFSVPFHTGVRERVVSHRASPLLQDRDSLAGESFFVRASSTYRASLETLARGLVAAGRPPPQIRHADEHLEDEDILELVNAGVIAHTVVDDYKANLWAEHLPDIRVEGVSVRENAGLAWGLRKGTPKLKAVVDEFLRGHRIGTEFGNVLAKRYFGDNRRLRKPLTAHELARFDTVVDTFRKYAAQYGFDPLLVTAQAYQESQLDQRARSPEGAVGIMQLLPRTGRAMNVGDIRELDANIHAGLKYLRELVDREFADPRIDDYNRTLLGFAAYNAGPTNIRRMQRIARARGLDPYRWFDHVERVTGERIGGEPVRYVASILKYYVAYRLIEEQRLLREQAKDEVAAH